MSARSALATPFQRLLWREHGPHPAWFLALEVEGASRRPSSRAPSSGSSSATTCCARASSPPTTTPPRCG
ncbi:MAG: hypothetical protein R3B09_09515 [Nannocystaceae bacterium]